MRPLNSHFAWLPLTILAVTMVAGCSRGPYEMQQVTGRVVYEDGSAVPGKLGIRFQSLEAPIDERTHPRPGYAYTDEQGAFTTVTTYKHADGVVRGKHKLLIGEVEGLGTLIDPKYGDPNASPIEVDTSDAPFEIRVSRPAKLARQK